MNIYLEEALLTPSWPRPPPLKILASFARTQKHIYIKLVCCNLQLLDEMIDNGFPLTTEANILREMIAPPNIVSKMLSVVTGNSSNVSTTLPSATASRVPWRTTDLKHSSNEVYVDLVEEMDATINRYLLREFILSLPPLVKRFLTAYK